MSDEQLRGLFRWVITTGVLVVVVVLTVAVIAVAAYLCLEAVGLVL